MDRTRSGLKAYTIGGARISMAEDPDALLKRMLVRLENGAGLSELFMLQWQRTAIHFSHMQQQTDALKRDIEALKREIEALKGKR